MDMTDLVETLQEAGLVVLDVEAGVHAGSRRIVKPADVAGNTRPGYEMRAPGGLTTDAPHLLLNSADDGYVLELRESVPGPGPGDFSERFVDLETCCSSILDYYFGDPGRMNP